MCGVTSKYIRRIIYSAAQLTELSFYFFCSYTTVRFFKMCDTVVYKNKLSQCPYFMKTSYRSVTRLSKRRANRSVCKFLHCPVIFMWGGIEFVVTGMWAKKRFDSSFW